MAEQRDTRIAGHTGSPLYMAPEVYCGELYNGAADVFGMGVVMYELFGRTMLLFSEINPNSRDAAAEVQGCVLIYACVPKCVLCGF